MMSPFKDNKYTRWYFSIVTRAKSRILDCYVERHHVLPRSLGGSDDDSNLASLTAKEHFVCHHLLTKMTTRQARSKMELALHCMLVSSSTNDSRYKPPARLYEQTKIALSALRRGQSKTEEHKRKIGESQRGKIISAETRQKMSEAARRRVVSAETRQKQSDQRKGKQPWNKGIPHSEEHKAKISAASQGENNGMYGRSHTEESRAAMRRSKQSS